MRHALTLALLLAGAPLHAGPVPCECGPACPCAPCKCAELLTYADARGRVLRREKFVLGVGCDPGPSDRVKCYRVDDAPKSVRRGVYYCYLSQHWDKDGRIVPDPVMKYLGPDPKLPNVAAAPQAFFQPQPLYRLGQT